MKNSGLSERAELWIDLSMLDIEHLTVLIGLSADAIDLTYEWFARDFRTVDAVVAGGTFLATQALCGLIGNSAFAVARQTISRAEISDDMVVVSKAELDGLHWQCHELTEVVAALSRENAHLIELSSSLVQRPASPFAMPNDNCHPNGEGHVDIGLDS